MSTWSSAKQFGSLWYKFQLDSENVWHILCSGDRDSLEPNSVICHHHYWKRNNQWYVQIKRGRNHVLSGDDFIQGVRRENERQNLMLSERQIKQEAHRRALRAYSKAGYGGRNRGVALDRYTGEQLDRLVAQYQSISSSSCFIATAAYETQNHPDLDTFRAFRDRVLLKHSLGRSLVKVYYLTGPHLAKIVSSYPPIKKFLRSHLERLAQWMRWQQVV